MALTEAEDMIPAAGEAPRVPTRPEQMFRCEFLACTLRGAICVQRQTQEVKARQRGAKLRKAFQYQHCASGNCRQGAEVQKAIGHLVTAPAELRNQGGGGYVRADKSTPGVMPLVDVAEPSPVLSPSDREYALSLAIRPNSPPQETPVTATPKIPDADRLHCKSCGEVIRRDNTTGLCKPCKKLPANKPLTFLQASKLTKPAPPPKQRRLPIAGDASLPEVTGLPSSYLVSCVGELKRRATEMYEAARSIGFDPADPDATPPQ